MDKLLLDTTYLLPIFGVRVKLKDYEAFFPRLLTEYTVMYNPISIVESKWIVIKLCKRYPSKKPLLLKTYRLGLTALLNSTQLKQMALTSPEVEEIADKLLSEAGLKDYFDRIIYATAVLQKSILLTEDKELEKIVQTNIPKPKKVMSWNNVIRSMGSSV